jgi:hypothetical protein
MPTISTGMKTEGFGELQYDPSSPSSHKQRAKAQRFPRVIDGSTTTFGEGRGRGWESKGKWRGRDWRGTGIRGEKDDK